MIVLEDADLVVRIDPRHGAEILDLIDLATGRQLLGRPPFGSAEPVAGDLDPAAWTASYRGGWQLVSPNAGLECDVDGERHGFHGRASTDPWATLEQEPARATLAWEGHGLRIVRELRLAGGALHVATTFTAPERRAPLVAVEHMALGLELIEPEVAIEVPGGLAFELSETEGPAETPADSTSWPEVRLLDGSVERGDRWRLAEPRSRYYVVVDLPEGSVVVRNPARGQSLHVTWDTGWLRHLWVWHESRRYPGEWREQTELLVVEPASVPHGLGLAAAIERGQAAWLEPGESIGYELVARPGR